MALGPDEKLFPKLITRLGLAHTVQWLKPFVDDPKRSWSHSVWSP